MKILDQLQSAGIIPVASVPNADAALHVCDALMTAALPLVEITFRTSAAAAAIAAAVQRFPKMLIGAGTVLSPEDVKAAHDAGASFGVAPGFNPGVVEAAHALDLPFFPGVSTPSEIENALQLGCTIQKLFPIEALGGVTYLKAVSAPYAHKKIRFIPTGGISLRNLAQYLTIPTVVAVGGSWIAAPDSIENAAWPSIANRAAEAVTLVNSIRDPRVEA
jgi:2-dehydro-3-deoxyphosphogluconate aldolase/(4S)-4-hydroxy-2-oxoglutarate aldolase